MCRVFSHAQTAVDFLFLLVDSHMIAILLML